ncbi:MAG: DUF2961 domain-containing protein, partial [Candidatus Omnitrophica bacterium]|nr:DUF2961 domain-containing protein [Candidatus Omnitrophota bacterium]
DENEKFYIVGEQTASIEFQGLEDSFGFSWGFPPTESTFPLTGFFVYLKGGAAAYRFFTQDAISFNQSLRVAIGFGVNEDPMFRREFSKPGSTLQLSSTVYWYQLEPHRPFAPMPPAVDRAPAPDEPFWPDKEPLPSSTELRNRGVKLYMVCGRPGKEVILAEQGYGAEVKAGYAFAGWELPVYCCRAANDTVQVELTVPRGTPGTVRVYIIDPDQFQGGRKETITIAGKSQGPFANFQNGRWIEQTLYAGQTSTGKVTVRAANARQDSNAVISIIEWVEPGK